MTAMKLDGKLYRDEVFEGMRARVTRLKEEFGVTPGLATVLVGDDPASHSYVRMKHRDCEEVGVFSIRKDLPADITQGELLGVVGELNADPRCTGFIVQLPIPAHLDVTETLMAIKPEKDVDGLHPVNLGKLVLRDHGPVPCTPNGIIHLLRRFNVPIRGKKVCVVGFGITVGRPLTLMLMRPQDMATVTICDIATEDLAAETRQADIIVCAVGSPHLITADMVKPGAAILDVGVSHVEGKLVGDVHPDCWEVAGAISSNPGGVGPLTRAFLVHNVIELAERSVGITSEY